MKIIKLVLVCVVLPAVIFGSLFIWAINSPISSPINKAWQYSFWKFPYTEYFVLGNQHIRRFLSFNLPGDEKYFFYGNNKYKNLVVELNVVENDEIMREVPPIIEKTFSKIFDNKNVSVVVNQTFPESAQSKFDKVYPSYYSSRESADTAVIKVIVLSDTISNVDKLAPGFSGINSFVTGLSLNSRTIFMRYLAPKQGFSSYRAGFGENPNIPNSQSGYLEFLWNVSLDGLSVETKNKVFEHTLVHEVGHILGVRHRTEPECVMTSKIESTAVPINKLDEVVNELKTDFCPQEMELLKQIRHIPLIRFGDYKQDYYTRTADF